MRLALWSDIPAWRRWRWDVVAPGLNVLLLVALALGVKLPFGGPLSVALAFLTLFALPGYLLLRLLLPNARFDPVTTLALSVTLGAGALSVLVVLVNLLHRFDFSPILLLHAGWQAVALAIWRRASSDSPLAESAPGAPAPAARRFDPVTVVYAVVAVAVVGGVIVAFAHFDLYDSVNLGGSDLSVYVSLANRLYTHPTEPPLSNARAEAFSFRLVTGAWAYQQALIAWVTGLTPLQTLITHGGGPALALAFAALFALSYEVTRRLETALLALPFTLGAYLLAFSEAANVSRDVTGFGYRVLRRITEDKIFAAHVFVPAALVLTLYLLDRAHTDAKGHGFWARALPWGALLAALAAVVGAHPLGFGQYLVIVGAYLGVRLLANPTRRALIAVGGTGLALLVVGLLPLSQLLTHRDAFGIFDWESVDLYAGLVRVGARGAYILNPSHTAAPIFVIGVAAALLLVGRVRRDRAALYLFASTLGPLALVYTPYVASTLGNIIKPDMLERLLWLLPIGLTLAYASGLILDFLRPYVGARLYPWLALIPLALGIALAWFPYCAVAQVEFDLSLRSAFPERTSPEIEVLAGAIRARVSPTDGGRNDFTPVLAPAEVNTYLYMAVSDAKVYHFRRGFVELHALYQNPWWGEDALGVFEDFAPAYLVAENGSHAQTFARLQPSQYTPVYENARYTLYETPGAWALTDTDRASTLVAHRAGSLVTALMEDEPPADDEATWARAATLYEAALRADPDDYRAAYGLAYTLSQTGDLDRAADLLRDLLDRFPDDGNVRVRLAEVLRAQNRMGEACDVLLSQLGPATLRAVLNSPYLGALDETQLAAALDAWEAAPVYTAGPHPSRALAARLLDARGDRDRAIRMLEFIPPAHRTSEDLRLLGTLYLIGGDAGRALAAFEADAGRSAAVTGLAHLLRGHLAAQAGDMGTARRAYQAAVDADPIPAAWIFLGQAAEASSDLAAAEDAYQRAAAVGLAPDFWETYAAYRASDHKDAEAWLVWLTPDTITQNFWGEAALCRFYTSHGDTASAEVACRRANTILDIASIPPFPPEYPPQIVSPLAAGVGGPRANIALPGDTALASFAVRNRTLAPRGGEALATLDWMTYRQAAAAPWWQIKVVGAEGDVLADYSQAALAPAGGMARWTFAAPVSVAPVSAGRAPADVLAVAIVPDEAGERIYTCRIGQIMPGPPPAPADDPATPTAHIFGDQVELYGYTLPAETAHAGETLTVHLYWRAIAPPDFDLTAFVHVLGADGQAVTQADAPPGPYPTSLWETGARAEGTFALALPDGLAPGVYPVVAGVYLPGTFARLPVDGWPDGTVPLGEIVVEAR